MKTEHERFDCGKLGKLILSYEGRCRGPEYGEVYTAPEGQHGYYAGCRSHAVPGAGLMDVKHFARLEDAENHACWLTD